jgi:formylmethanofuran dehydrogenase subunit E
MNREDRIAALSTFQCDECGRPITKDKAQHYEDETARCRPCANSLTRKPSDTL